MPTQSATPTGQHESTRAQRSLVLRRRAAVALGTPCRMGVPLPRGAVREASRLRLIGRGDSPLPLQAAVLQRWPDASVKWLLCEWLHDGADEVRLTDDAPTPANTPDRQATVEREGDAIVVRRDASAWRFGPGGALFGQSDNAVRVLLEASLPQSDSVRVDVTGVELLAEGPVRVGVRTSGRLLAGSYDTGLDVFAESHFYADSTLRRTHLTVRNRRRAAHAGGVWELGDAGSVLIRDLSLAVTAPADATSFRCDLGDAGSSTTAADKLSLLQASSGGERWDSSNHVNRDGVVPLPFRGYRLEADGQTTEGRRAEPVVACTHAGGAFAVAVERFWQNFPKAIESRGDGLRVGLFPREAAAPHELQGGEQKTHVVWIAEHASGADVLASVDHTAPFWPDPESVAASGAERFVRPTDGEHGGYRRLVTEAVDGESSLLAKREVIDEYGWRHFGDAYGDHEAAFSPPEPPLVSHWNNQYDLVFGLGVRALGGGDPRWWELMEDHARHVIDIDLYHTDEDKAAYNHGLFWHTIHYLDAGKANHRSYPSGTIGGGPSAEQTYTRGLRLYYYLTGDRAARDAVVACAEWVLAMEDGSRTPFRWLAGGPTGLSSSSGNPDYHGPGRGPGNATETLLTAFELTGDGRYLDRVEELMRRVVHPRDDQHALDLLDAETRWYYNLYLQALGRYLEIKHEHGEHDEAYAYGRQTLLAYADWMAEHEYPYLTKPDILEYPTETWSAQDVRKSEVFHFAARHAADASRRERYLERGEYFFAHAVEELLATPAARYTRPLALLLGSGFSYRAIRAGAGELSTAPAPEIDPPPKPRFTPQKARAVRRAKLIVAGGAVGVAALILVGVVALLAS
ncbi:hypothetical protein [Botrimarina sp.]|uniref:RIFT barrel domain-containing protein n=1 Tax=Botrimarina sp. TaxID=2795802 RepID=UPI0032EF8087